MDRDQKGGAIVSMRNISFLVLMGAVVAALLFRSAPERSRPEEIRNLLSKQNRLVVALYMPQILRATQDAEKRLIMEGVETVFAPFERLYGKGDPEVRLPVYIIREFLKMGDSVKPPLDDSSRLTADFRSLFLDNHPVGEESPLFSLPAGELVRIKQLEVSGKRDEAVRFRERLLAESVVNASRFYLFFLSIMLLFPIGFSVIYTFAKRRPAPIFDGSVKKIPEQSVALLYETPLLYLFLLFPVASFLISVLPYAGSIFFHLLYIPVTFVAILYYFIRSSGSPASLRSLLGMDEKQNPLREVGFGIIGFTAIFPVALLSLLFSFGVAGNDLETVRFAHPITFEVGSHFWPVFFLAVVIAPITEEIIFRGFIFGYLRRHLPLRRAALLTGMIFAILHPQGWLAFLYLTVVGGGLAILREYRPGLIAPIVTHAMINSFAVISIHLLWSI